MTVEEYSLDTNRSIEEILKKCKELGINASNKDDFLEDDDIIYLDNELVNNEENLLKKGMTGKLELVLEEKNNVLKIPKEAIIEKNGKSYVFVVVNNYAEEREVLLGITDDSNVEVLKGLKMQDKIVIDGNKNLKGNDKVYIWKEGE